MRGAAYRVAPAKTGCIKLLHYADMVMHGADQVETQTVNEAILNKFFGLWVTPECHIAERAIFACLSYILPYQNKILEVLGIQESLRWSLGEALPELSPPSPASPPVSILCSLFIFSLCLQEKNPSPKPVHSCERQQGLDAAG